MIVNSLPHSTMRCLIVENHPATRLGLHIIVKQNFPAWEVFGAETVEQAAALFWTNHDAGIDILILEIMLIRHVEAGTLARLKQMLKSRLILGVAFSGARDREVIDMSRELGTRGYISKSAPEPLIVRALEDICAGKEYFLEEETRTSGLNVEMDDARITRRQKDVLDLVLAGYSNKEIASTLKLSYGTVKNYVFDLMRLLRVKSRLELATKLLGRAGWPVPSEPRIPPPDINRRTYS